MSASTLRRTIVIVATAAGLLAPTGPASAGTGDQEPVSDESLIVDDADLLDDNRVVDALNNLERTGDSTTRVAVFTTDEVTKDGYDQAVTKKLIDRDPKGVIDDGKLASDVVVVTISPEVRQVGIYAGDDAPRNDRVTKSAVETMRPFAREKDWDNVAFTGGLEYLTGHDLVQEPSGSTPTDSDAIPGHYILIGLLILLIAGGIGNVLIRVTDAREKRRRETQRERDIEQFRLAHTEQDIDRAQKTWNSIHEVAKTHPSAVAHLTSCSPTQIGEFVTELTQLQTRHYRPTPQQTRDVPLREAIENTDASRIADLIEMSEKSKHHWQQGLREEMQGVARELADLVDEAEEMELPEKPLAAVHRRSERAVERILTNIDAIDDDQVDPLTGIEGVLSEKEDALAFAKGVVRGLSQVERAEVTRPAMMENGSSSAHLWPTYAAVFLASSSSLSSTAATSSATSFSGGGFSGGSGGF